MGLIVFVMANFTIPEDISVTPLSMLWLLPLAASIAVVYKATKVSKIKAASFIRESAVLFGSILVFMLATALVLLILAWVFTQ